MYFPYLRGRQYELIALRELLEKGIISKKILPIIEPVKLSSTLIKTIESYNDAQRGIGVIVNPIVGNFFYEANEEKNQSLKESFIDCIKYHDRIILFKILNSSLEKEKNDENKIGTICLNKDSIMVYENLFQQKKTEFNLIPDGSLFRRRIRENRVLLADRFNKQDRNNDYLSVEDEPFSDDHLYYKDDGYVGFSDYSVIGNEYNDTGFAPYAVAIHIVYFDDDSSLRIRHFVSNSNDDISDPAGKFKEALSKLVEWNEKKRLDTFAMEEFGNLYRREAYPGLGTVKKLSIMHHLELIGKYLDRNSV